MVFSYTNTTTDLECFYDSVMDIFEDPEQHEVNDLLVWWNQYIYSLGG